ncbi:MAG: hypothetical protein CMN55_16580 [Sneathiella sp.]|jgi:TRAP-type C4-dicarboxylate transport system permease small subunit|uniref:TRAP transporter small permease n=1 Tax=Sneathiella sp. TaxID=1964365 RepID=UPI000C3D3D61|nr:TRAP transporter small permease subunit [Sneathiella sp.]MAL80695.1 hypothetical protein [Sneathiella sp.]|tara:strand:- start:359 stop:880 length:522 start_codon:yes stop_codon:yes gene_type:complete
MRRLFETFCIGLEKITGIICVLLMFTIVIAMACQIFFRYFFNLPLPYTDEISLISLTWMTFLGAGWIYRRRAHITVELLSETGSQTPFLRITDFIGQISVIAILLLLASQALELTPQAMRLEMGTLELSRFFMHYLPLLISCTVIVIFAIEHAFNAFFAQAEKEMHVVTSASE